MDDLANSTLAGADCAPVLAEALTLTAKPSSVLPEVVVSFALSIRNSLTRLPTELRSHFVYHIDHRCLYVRARLFACLFLI